MERQQYFINLDSAANDDLFVRQSFYQSNFKGDLGKQDTIAKKIHQIMLTKKSGFVK